MSIPTKKSFFKKARKFVVGSESQQNFKSKSAPNSPLPPISFTNEMNALRVEFENLEAQLNHLLSNSFDIGPLGSYASQFISKINQLLPIFLRDFYYPLKWSRLHKETERAELLERFQNWHRQFQKHVNLLSKFNFEPQVQETIKSMKSALLYNSMVTSVQPPRVVRRCTHFFDTTVQSLYDNEQQEENRNGNGESSQVKIFMLDENEIVKLFQNWEAENQNLNLNLNPNFISPSVFVNLAESRNILKNVRIASNENEEPETDLLNITNFEGLVVNEMEHLSNTSEKIINDPKFCLLYLKTVEFDGVAMETWCISLPFVLISSYSQRCPTHAIIFWDNYFRKKESWLPFQVEEETNWTDLSSALIDYFKSETETEWNLTPANLKYIGKKIFKTDRFHGNSTVDRKSFCFFQYGRQDKMTMWEWLFSIVELIKTHLAPFWNSGAIVGFISRVEAEKLIQCKNPGTFLIRFSDSFAGGVYYTAAMPPTPQDIKRGYKSGAQSVGPLSDFNQVGLLNLRLWSLDQRIMMSSIFKDVLYFEPTGSLNYKKVLVPKGEKFTRPHVF